MEKQRFLEAGQIVNTHGIRGELKILPWVDSAEFLSSFKTLYIGGQAMKVRSARVHKGCLIALLEGVDDINAAMALKNKTVCIDRKDAKLPRGRFFIADIIGARVVDASRGEIGTVSQVLTLPAQNVLVVKANREIMIPMVDEFVQDIDIKNGLITVRLIEGM